jgi:hypothetical protein
MQMALASFGVLALMLAGCSSTATVTPTTDETTEGTVEATGSMDVVVPTTDSAAE